MWIEQRAEDISAEIKQTESNDRDEHTAWMSTIVMNAKNNMKNKIRGLSNSIDWDIFIDEVNQKIDRLKQNAIEEANKDSIKQLLMLTNIRIEWLDDLLDTWKFDFSWDFDLDNPEDRQNALAQILWEQNLWNSFYNRAKEWTDIVNDMRKTWWQSRVDQINRQINEAMWR